MSFWYYILVGFVASGIALILEKVGITVPFWYYIIVGFISGLISVACKKHTKNKAENDK